MQDNEDDHTGEYDFRVRIMIDRVVETNTVYFPYVHTLVDGKTDEYYNVMLEDDKSVADIADYILEIFDRSKRRLSDDALVLSTALIYIDWVQSIKRGKKNNVHEKHANKSGELDKFDQHTSTRSGHQHQRGIRKFSSRRIRCECEADPGASKR